MPKRTRLLLISLAATGAISATVLGLDAAIVGGIALGICIVILAIQFAIAFVSKAPASKVDLDGLVEGTKHVEPSVEEPGSYNPRNPMVPFHWDPP